MPRPYEDYKATIYDQFNKFPKSYEPSIYEKMGSQQVKDVKTGFRITDLKSEEKRRKKELEKEKNKEKQNARKGQQNESKYKKITTVQEGPVKEKPLPVKSLLVASSLGSMQRTLALFDLTSREATPKTKRRDDTYS